MILNLWTWIRISRFENWTYKVHELRSQRFENQFYRSQFQRSQIWRSENETYMNRLLDYFECIPYWNEVIANKLLYSGWNHCKKDKSKMESLDNYRVGTRYRVIILKVVKSNLLWLWNSIISDPMLERPKLIWGLVLYGQFIFCQKSRINIKFL